VKGTSLKKVRGPASRVSKKNNRGKKEGSQRAPNRNAHRSGGRSPGPSHFQVEKEQEGKGLKISS